MTNKTTWGWVSLCIIISLVRYNVKGRRDQKHLEAVYVRVDVICFDRWEIDYVVIYVYVILDNGMEGFFPDMNYSKRNTFFS